jgi:hypothetical protein
MTTSPRALAITRQRALADTARTLARGPIPRHRLDADALATLDALGLVAHSTAGLTLNCSHGGGSAIACLARGDLKRAAAFARPKRTAA